MDIVILDGYTLNPGDNPWDEIGALGRLTVYDRTAPEQVVARGRQADILLINKCPLRADALGQMPRLKFIAVTATGFDCVDIEAAGRRGIPVSNLPVYGTDSVAQFVMALLLEHCHHVAVHDRAVKAGEWTRCPDWSFRKTAQIELRAKVMGIVGFGRIGRRVGELAHAFGMEVVAHDIHEGPPPGYEPFSRAGIEALFRRADVVSLHTPLTQDNRGFVDKRLLALMKPGAMLINAARGELVNTRDLAEALRSGGLACAALDVVEQEPVAPDNPLLGAPNVIMTPHMAWSTNEARLRMIRITAENVKAFIGGAPQNLVNAAFLKTSR